MQWMQSTLGASSETITWVLTSYIIATAVSMPITGWLSNKVGARLLFLCSVAGFIIASMLFGIAQSLAEMVAFRALQGIAGAFISPLSQSFMLDATRLSKRGQIMALWGMGVVIGPVLGPILGGLLTENWNWRWVFYVNLPVGIAALTILLAQMPSREIRKRRFDLFGFAMIAVALSSLQLFLDRGNEADWFSSIEIWIYLAVAISSAWIAAVHLATSRNPLFHGALFAVYVEQPGLPLEDRRMLERNIEAARRLDAAVSVLRGDDVVAAILNFANREGITQIFVGHSQRAGFWQRFRSNPVERLILESGEIDIRVFPQAAAGERG